MAFVEIRVVCSESDNLICIMAGGVWADSQRKLTLATGISSHLRGIRAHGLNRGIAHEDCGITVKFGSLAASLHISYIRHSASEICPRNLQAEVKRRLKKNGFGLAQSLSHRAIGSLAEVTALRMLQMRLTRDEGKLNVGDRRAHKDSLVRPFLKMGYDQPLPVQRKRVGIALGSGHDSLASR